MRHHRLLSVSLAGLLAASVPAQAPGGPPPELDSLGARETVRLVRDGDLWRLITANLIHWDWLHLGINLGLLVPLAVLLEGGLGAARAACVMLGAALGGMLLAGAVDASSVIGSSGIVFGVAGALLWVDINRGRHLPAWSRLPRSWLVILLVVLAMLQLPYPLSSVKFVAAHPAVTCVTPATSQAKHMIDNMGAAHGKLPNEEQRKRMIEVVDALPPAPRRGR